MAFKNSQTKNGSYISHDLSFINADNTVANGYDVTTEPSNETKITASDGAANDYFGYSVAIGYGRIVVGAIYDDDDGSNSGSAYIFDLDGTQLAKITASDASDSDYFGNSVSIGSGRIVVGAYGANSTNGAAYIFDLNGNQIAKITASDGASNDKFGISVAVGSGRIVVGSDDDDNGADSGSVYIFDLDGNQLAKIKPSDGAAYKYFGNSVAIGCGRIVVGAAFDDDNGSGSGAAYIFDLDGNELAKITASDGDVNDYFGRSVAVGLNRIVVSAYGDSDNGLYSGSAYIFDLNGNQLAKIKPSDGAVMDAFGYSPIAIGSGRIVVGSLFDDDNGSSSGSAYIFDLDGNELAKITASDGASDDQFGCSAAVGSGRIVVGAFGDDDNGSSSGSVYIWETPVTQHILDIFD